MWRRITIAALGMAAMTACTTPYSPSVHVRGTASFDGIVEHLKEHKVVDVVLVHGMCKHNETWAHDTMNQIMQAIDPGYSAKPLPESRDMAAGPIEVIEREERAGGGAIRFAAVLWSPLTAAAKDELKYDMTGVANDCTSAAQCKPRRAYFNGKVKDKLLNDCLSDVLLYQGARPAFTSKMAAALAPLFTRFERGMAADTPLVLITESLGSKITFDALEHMGAQPAPDAPALAAAALDVPGVSRRAIDRTRILVMAANQLPLLGLMDDAGVATASLLADDDPLRRFLRARSDGAVPRPVTVVALNDPNDLLSYRLQPARYAAMGEVSVADILVSNRKTYLGLLEEPWGAHSGYLGNRDVARLIACGSGPARQDCR